MNAASAAIWSSERSKGGMPFSGRPLRTTTPILSPLTSAATSFERVKSGPLSPPRGIPTVTKRAVLLKQRPAFLNQFRQNTILPRVPRSRLWRWRFVPPWFGLRKVQD